MAATPATAYYCSKCKRPLSNLGRKDTTNDTVSTKWVGGRPRFFHDGCGRHVAPGLTRAT